MKKILVLILFVLFFCSAVVARAQDIRHGKVISKEKDKRIITVQVDNVKDLSPGTAFILYDKHEREIGCILVERVKGDTFVTDLLPIDIFNQAEIGTVVIELGAGCRIEGTVISYIPKGFFGMGDNKEDNEMPMHSVYLNAYYIDKHEVSNKEYKKFVDETGYGAPYVDSEEAAPYNWVDKNFPSGSANKPVVLVNADDAKKYCEFAGKRLPTEEEWEKAARGTGSRIWPWGNVWEASKTNIKENGYGNAKIIGSFPDDLSPYDVVDMGGNVSEWTSSRYLPYENNHIKDENYSKNYIVLRGGSFLTGENSARAAARQFASPDKKAIDIGFRCVKEIFQ